MVKMQTADFVNYLLTTPLYAVRLRWRGYPAPFPILTCGLFLHPINYAHTHTAHFCHTDGGKDIKMDLNDHISLLLL